MSLQVHYNNLFDIYGDSHKTAQWSSRESQELRFKYLLEFTDEINLHGNKILDFGCGTGHLATYLEQKNIHMDYVGVDIVPSLIQCAKSKHPELKFYLDKDLPEETYDYIVISGVFNNKIDDNMKLFQETIMLLKSKCKGIISLNMLSSYVDYQDNDLYYFKPEEVFTFLKENVSPYIVLRNEYQLKENIIPFEFTTYIYMK